MGALGPRLTRAVAEHADGLLVMPFGNKKFLHEVTMAAVDEGLAAAGRDRADLAIVPEIIVSVGDDHAATRQLLAFYGSTPAYRPVLDVHGWGDLQPELNALSKQGRWAEMGGADRRRRAAHHRRMRHTRRGGRPYQGPGGRYLGPDLHLPARTDRGGFTGADR